MAKKKLPSEIDRYLTERYSMESMGVNPDNLSHLDWIKHDAYDADFETRKHAKLPQQAASTKATTNTEEKKTVTPTAPAKKETRIIPKKKATKVIPKKKATKIIPKKKEASNKTKPANNPKLPYSSYLRYNLDGSLFDNVHIPEFSDFVDPVDYKPKPKKEIIQKEGTSELPAEFLPPPEDGAFVGPMNETASSSYLRYDPKTREIFNNIEIPTYRDMAGTEKTGRVEYSPYIISPKSSEPQEHASVRVAPSTAEPAPKKEVQLPKVPYDPFSYDVKTREIFEKTKLPTYTDEADVQPVTPQVPLPKVAYDPFVYDPKTGAIANGVYSPPGYEDFIDPADYPIQKEEKPKAVKRMREEEDRYFNGYPDPQPSSYKFRKINKQQNFNMMLPADTSIVTPWIRRLSRANGVKQKWTEMYGNHYADSLRHYNAPTRVRPSGNKYREFYFPTAAHRKETSASHLKYEHPVANKPSAVVLHHTGDMSRNLYKTLQLLVAEKQDGREVSSHSLIGFDGTRVKLAEPNQVTFHAGESRFNGKNAVNDFSIGIEFQGNTGRKPLTQDQIDSAIEYLTPILKKYNIRLEDITTHRRVTQLFERYKGKKKAPRKPDITATEFYKFIDEIQKKVYEAKHGKQLPEGFDPMIGRGIPAKRVGGILYKK